MAAEFKIGRLRYTWAGAWQPGTTYGRDNVVQYQGQMYVCQVPNTSSSNFYNDLYASPYVYWTLMIPGHTFSGTWSTGQLYSLGNLVIFDGSVYQCTTSHTSTVFSNDAGNWTVYVRENTWLGAWQPNTNYGIGALVTYGGITYKCTIAHTSAANTSLGLETNQADWAVWYNGVAYLGAWQSNYRYKANDLVKLNSDIYICTTYHTSGSTFNSADFTMWMPGQDFEFIWSSATVYQIGDAVLYGGNAYLCTTANNVNSIPSSLSGWVLFNQGYSIQGAWNSGTAYLPGNVVTRNGMVYEAISGATTTTITATAVSGYNITVSSTSGLVVGNTISFGSTLGNLTSSTVYYILTIVDSYTLQVSSTPNGALFNVGSASGSVTATVVISNNVNQDPSGVIVTKSYNPTGSSGTTIVINSTANLTPGMIVSATGITQGQMISSITDGTTLVLDRQPDGTLLNGQSISFIGPNVTYWKFLIPGKQWENRWLSGSSYLVGDIVLWINTTYTCIQNHTSSNSTTSPNRPDLDSTNSYWTVLIAGNRNNSLTNYGDIETYNNNQYTPVAIGTNSYNFRVNGNVPNWQQINVVPAVFYVDTYIGVDASGYGSTWDRPWKTINYACNIIGKGLYFPNSTAILQANKGWMITEMYQWMLYQCANNIAPFSTTSLFDPFYTQRDAGYIIDAVIYDMQRGGNSQTVAATLRWFKYGSQTILANQLIESAIAYFAPSLSYLQSLMLDVLTNASPAVSYQVQNGIAVGSSAYVSQTFSSGNTETGSADEVNSLMTIPVTAVTNQNTYAVPSSNSGLTAILNIKTGTYNESLPIIVPENLSIVGDELRSVTVQPAVSLEFYATSTNSSTNVVTVTNTAGLTDQMPMQFIQPYVNNANTSFDSNINPGQTYYILGSSITSTGFQLLDAPNVTFTGTIVTGSNVLSNVSQITNLKVGMTVTGTGIPSGTTVTAFSQAISTIATVTLSNTATTSGILQTFVASGNVVTLAGGSGKMLCYAGDCLKDMWYMTNGTTMRNLSNFGLQGMLSQTDAYGIARPTGGKYTSLNPGTGPDDTRVWIIRRSPYVQNVTNFGTGCAGIKVDGTLHNGGTKAMLHNDYTQVISDGIGVWITGTGAISECVSVFSYYCYIGHFAEAGGRIRSTNGNSSYGTFGVVSHGYDLTEIPATGTIFNQSQQVQASVQQAFGTTQQLLKLLFSNAGSAYYSPATNMLGYSNLFAASNWVSDGNISFIKNEVAPTGFTEGWLLTGSKSTAGTGYIQQSVSINPAGKTYTGVGGTTQNGAPGNSATFNVTVTSKSYSVTVNAGGTLYAVGNTIVINGAALGGISGTNDLTITVGTLSGTAILSISSVTGTVPAGSAQTYTLSMYVYAGTSSTVDLQAIFSGSSTVVSGISYNVTSNVVTPYAGNSLSDSSNAGMLPVNYGAIKTLVTGWYRIWLAVNDITGINNTITYKFFPSGANNPVASTYSIVYGSQLELSGSTPPPDFYLETTTGMFTAYANFEVVGAGSGALLAGEDTRSGGVFNARIVTDSNNYTGGYGYVTAQNEAQYGTKNSIQLAQSDTGTNNYFGMRVFINSGIGAGQYGYISYYNGSGNTVNGIASKTALVCQESFDPLTITTATYSATPANNVLSILTGSDLSKLYVNQPVQFLPTYYTTVISSTSTASITATATVGGTTNTISVNTAGLQLNMPVVFSGATNGGFNLTAGYTYYIVTINASSIQVSNVIYGNPVQLSNNSSATMVMTYPNYSGYLNSSSTSNMTPNFPIQFTGFSLGGVTLGQTYYINDIIDVNNFTLSTLLVSGSTVSTTSGSNTVQVASTASLVPMNPVVFSGTMYEGSFTSGQTYYISNIVDGTNFQVASSIIRTTATATTFGTNYITMSTVTGLVLNQPIIFYGIAAGSTFGNIVPETVYYIQTINSGSSQITISASTSGGVAGSAFVLTSTTGVVFARTCPAALTLGGSASAMGYATTGARTVVTNSVGSINSMNSAFSTSVFGGLNSYTIYYVTSIIPGTTTNISVSTTLGGTPVTLTAGSGNMQLAASGWDHINPGTPPSAFLDTTSVYYVEPRTYFTLPSFSQTAGTAVTIANGTNWQDIVYGQNYFLALPSSGATGAQSSDGKTWSSMSLPSGVGSWTSMAYGNFYYIALGTLTAGSVSIAAYSNSAGAGWRYTTMPSNTTWNQIAYGNGRFVAIATGTTSAAYTINFGASWTASTLPASKTWVSLDYGSGIFLAIASDGTGAWSYDGSVWFSTQLPQSTVQLGTDVGYVTIASSSGTLTFGNTVAQLVVGQSVVISGTNTGTGLITNGTYYIYSTDGKSTCVLSSTSGTYTAISTTSGTTTQKIIVGAPNYTSVAFGNGRFVAIQNGSGLYAAYSFNGTTWYQSNTYLSANLISYGQGAFVAVQSSGTTEYKTDSGQYWFARSLTYGSITALCFGFTASNTGVWATLTGTGAATGSATVIQEGVKPQGRATITSSVMTTCNLWEPGSNYSVAPTCTFIDYNASVTSLITPRISNGVLANPTFVNPGQGYNTNSTSVTITGNGYADTYQTGYTLIINNLSSLPLVGSNLSIAGNSQVYKVTSAVAVYNTQAPFIEANVQVSPTMTNALSPANGAAVSIRQLYSQVRLTNHDFLSIGVGNREQTNYPYVDESTAIPSNEAVEVNQGHVFYVSTDENGNFQVGSLFGVEQATGTVTLSATQFGLQGLSQLSLGGIAVGGASVVVTQFSTDPTFVANSDAIIPTQRAIKSYLAGRLSQGGANTFTGTLIAGTVQVGGAVFLKSTVPNGTTGSSIKFGNKVYFGAVAGGGSIGGPIGVDGHWAAFDFFTRNAFRRS